MGNDPGPAGFVVVFLKAGTPYTAAMTDGETETGKTAGAGTGKGCAVEVCAGAGRQDLLLVCDHASNALPAEYAGLGLEAALLESHIAYDPGAGDLTRLLSRALGCPAVLGAYSRLLVDLNRGEDDPTLVMQLSDGVCVPGNAGVGAFDDTQAFERRLARYYRPFHAAIGTCLASAQAEGITPALVSLHSFTPVWKGRPRPWEAGILWDQDDRLARPLMAALQAEGLCVGDNEPYGGYLEGDTLYRHGTQNGLPHVLIEIRQDLLRTPVALERWCALLVRVLDPLLHGTGMKDVRYYGSRMDKKTNAPPVLALAGKEMKNGLSNGN